MGNSILEGISMGLLLSVMVGPVFFMLITSSMAFGFRYAIFFALGIVLSDLVYILFTYFGVHFLTRFPWVEFALGIGGGIILFGLGIKFFLKNPKGNNNLGHPNLPSKGRAIVTGFGINGINPFVLLFWMSIASLVHQREVWQTQEVLGYYVGLMGTVFFTDLGKAFLARKLADHLTENVLSLLNKGVGILLMGLGLRMIYLAFLGLD